MAPPRALRGLREALDAVTRTKLVGTLEKDLVKTPDHALWAACSRMGQPRASPGRLICIINAAARKIRQRWATEPAVIQVVERRSPMANTPVEENKTAPAAAEAPISTGPWGNRRA